MLDTLTRLHAAIPADRSASSKDVSFSRCFPTPLVKNISFGTNPTTLRSLSARGNLHGKHQVFECQENRGPRAGRHDRLGSLTISHHNEFVAYEPAVMTRVMARDTARKLLEIMPLV